MVSVAKFDALLEAMLTKVPKDVGKTASKPQSSSEGVSADYAGTQIRADKSASASSKRKYKSPK